MDVDYLLALKLFLVIGPVLGFASLELVLLIRDKRRRAEGRPLVPERFARASQVRVPHREVRLRKR